MAVNDLITFRKGTASQWISVNPVLASGEPGYDLTNEILKIGDGSSVWTQLSGVNQNIVAGYDISITSNSGIYTIASTNLVHVDSKQPQGFINRTDSRISVSGNIFTIAPTGSSYSFYNQGIKVTKTSGESLAIPNLTQINYIHFDTINSQLSNKTTTFDFSTDIPIAYVAWNSGVGPSGQMTFFAEERHGIVMDTSTHKWIHNTFGAQYVDGLSIGNYVLGGNGTSNSHATISIGNGTLYQEDIEINITDSSSTDPFCQELSPIAQIPVYYHEGSTGQWVKNTATDYPVKYGANGPQYNLLSGGVWTTPDVSPDGQTRYFAVWILATNQIDDPIISIMGQRIDSSQGSAENNNLWSDVNLTNLPLSEVKPLYRLIFAGDRDYTNAPKCSLHSILDIRVAVISTIAGVSQNDHGSLFGLGDDDHSQYVHIDNARTIDANHTFTNGLTSNGLISSSSGNFTSSLQVNGTGVSISGHTHVSSDITNFNSSVSGLLPVKNLIAGTGMALSSLDGVFTINATSTGGGGGGIFNIVEDTTPQLGGDLDLNSYDIINSGNININGNITCDYIYSDLSGTMVYANSGNFIDSLQVNGTGEINNIIADRITSNEQIIVESTGVIQSGITISKPSINISNIGDSSFATNSNIIGVQIITDSNISQNTFQYSRAFYGENKHLIASGVANSGNSVAMQFAGMRNFSSSGDAGYLNALYGIAIQYGHNILDSGVTPQTNNIYGLYIEPYNGYGTINNSYDIFARPAAYSIEDYGVINNSYGIYIQGSNKKHLLEGKLGIGTNNPSYQLDVIGSGNFSQNLFVNGTGVSISGHSHTSSNISDFNSSVSGLLPVKNIIAGSNVTVSSTSGIYTINSTASGGGGGSSSTTVRGNIIATGTLSSFNVVGGYTVGYLDLFQNGSKLLNGNDFTATDGTSVILTNSVTSGTVLEYISLEASLTTTNYTKLDSISSSFNGSSTSFGLAVSGTPYYPVSANTLGIYVGGVAQEPIVSYSVSGSNIIFTEAPVSGLTFWGVGYGTTAVATLNGIVPGSASSPAISSSNDLNTGFYFPSSGNISVAGNLGIGTSSPSTLLDINNDKFRVRNSKTPSSPSDSGNQGDICWDSSYIYVCTNTNSWTRTPISAWSSDPYFSYVSLLLHMNGTGSSFIDSSVSPKEITAVGAATQSATQSKWGGKSLELNGSTSNLSLSSSEFTLSGDFVIETWIYLSSLSSYGPIVEARSSPSYSDFICGIYDISGTLRPDFVTAGGAGARLTGTSTSISLNTWTHVAFVRNNGVISAFVNGVRDSTQINYSSTITPASANILIGRNVDGNFINGYIDDLRITVGSSRGYTGSTITVPTAAFPDYNT